MQQISLASNEVLSALTKEDRRLLCGPSTACSDLRGCRTEPPWDALRAFRYIYDLLEATKMGARPQLGNHGARPRFERLPSLGLDS
ncbi:hypothetical protein ACPCTK_32445 [Streptomyces pseudogriseolus]|uniref:hypothetical protein n=1 Tax=Streptomyces pseudogriseolus TaxID=36817 RepID=UPI003FA317E8